MLSVLLVFAIRFLLVALFLLSAVDKVVEWDAAVDQADESLSPRALAKLAIVAGFAIELAMSLGVVTGVADRLSALVLAGYCGVTALLWKPFWKPGDFWVHGPSRARGLFWDFWKNLAVAGGFLLIPFGLDAASVDRGVDRLIADPLSSTRPYASPPR